MERVLYFLQHHRLGPSEENNAKLAQVGMAPLHSGISYFDLLRRQDMDYATLSRLFDVPQADRQVAEQVEIQAKYDGYISKQKAEVAKALKLEAKRLPADFDYLHMKELSREAAEKLDRVQPRSIGQAARISGVSPADIGVLLVALEAARRQKDAQDE